MVCHLKLQLQQSCTPVFWNGWPVTTWVRKHMNLLSRNQTILIWSKSWIFLREQSGMHYILHSIVQCHTTSALWYDVIVLECNLLKKLCNQGTSIIWRRFPRAWISYFQSSSQAWPKILRVASSFQFARECLWSCVQKSKLLCIREGHQTFRCWSKVRYISILL